MNLIEASYRVTRQQSEILFDARKVKSRCERLICKLPRDLRADLFEYAWQKATDRHSVLRTAFEWKGLREPVQFVNASADCTIDKIEVDSGFAMRHDLIWNHRFDPVQAPLMSLSLGSTSDGEWLFAWTSHDLILDARARRIVMKDVAEIYESLLHSRPIRPVASPTFQAYVERFHQADSGKAAAYGRNTREESSNPCKLMIPGCSEEIQGDPWAAAAVSISRESGATLRDFAQKTRVPVDVAVQSAWAVLLSKYSGECDVSFGALQTTTVDLPEALEIVGPLASTVLRHLNVNPSRTIADVAHELNALIRESAAVPSARSDIHSSFSTADAEPCETMVRLETDATWQPHLDNAFWRDPASRALTGCGLTLAGSVGSTIKLEIVYDRARCESASAADMANHLSCLLESMCHVERIGQLSANNEKSKRRLMLVGDSSGLQSLDRENVYGLFERQVRRVPGHVAVVHEGRRVSYLELERKVDQLATRLHRSGIGPEEIVGLYLPRGLNLIAGLLAVLKSGGAYLPLDMDAPAERIRDILLDAKPRCILAEQKMEAMNWATCELVCIEEVEKMPASPPSPAARTRPNAAAYVLYTSGSTGRPKGVVVEHRQLLNYVNSVIQRAGLEECGQFAMLQPLTVDSSVTVLYASLCKGASLHVIGDELAMDPVALSAYFEGETIDCLKIAPSHLAALHTGVAPSRLVPLRLLIVGGEASAHPWLASVACAAPGCTIFNHYGPTETTVGVLMHRFDGAQCSAGGLVPLGQPLANCRAYVLDRHGEFVPRGVIGELYIGGDSVARGYINRPVATAVQFLPDPFAPEPGQRMYRTGDLVRCLSGDVLEFCGRADDQVKIRGYRVEPGEITSVLQQHPDVTGAVVVPFRCASGGQQLAAFVVSCCGKPLERALRTFLSSRLPHYMIPSDVTVLDKFPLSRHGKVDIRALPRPAWAVEAQPDGRCQAFHRTMQGQTTS
jgi:amino acid adenylation domain-containing protein